MSGGSYHRSPNITPRVPPEIPLTIDRGRHRTSNWSRLVEKLVIGSPRFGRNFVGSPCSSRTQSADCVAPILIAGRGSSRGTIVPRRSLIIKAFFITMGTYGDTHTQQRDPHETLKDSPKTYTLSTMRCGESPTFLNSIACAISRPRTTHKHPLEYI